MPSVKLPFTLVTGCTASILILSHVSRSWMTSWGHSEYCLNLAQVVQYQQCESGRYCSAIMHCGCWSTSLLLILPPSPLLCLSFSTPLPLFFTHLFLPSSSSSTLLLSISSLFTTPPFRVQGVHFWGGILQLCSPCYCHHGPLHPWHSDGAAHWKPVPPQRITSAGRGSAAAAHIGGSGRSVFLQGSLVRVFCGRLQHSVCHVCS